MQQLEQHSFIETVADFKKSSVENKLALLIEKLKENAESKMSAYQSFVDESNKKKLHLIKEIDELKLALERVILFFHVFFKALSKKYYFSV